MARTGIAEIDSQIPSTLFGLVSHLMDLAKTTDKLDRFKTSCVLFHLAQGSGSGLKRVFTHSWLSRF